MTISELLFGGDENIDYGQLPESVVHDLAVAEDPAVSSSALRELKRRGSTRFGSAITALLEAPGTDPHVRADALELAFSHDSAAAVRYIERKADTLDVIAWRSVVELMVMESAIFLRSPASACAIYTRFLALPQPRPGDAEMLDAFEETYSKACSPTSR